jgi:hypothetical protein
LAEGLGAGESGWQIVSRHKTSDTDVAYLSTFQQDREPEKDFLTGVAAEVTKER